MVHSRSSTYSFMSDFDDGVITPVDSPTQAPEVKLDHTSFVASLSSGRQPWHDEMDTVSLFNDSDALPASLCRLARSSRPQPLSLHRATTPPTSVWFDDTPTQSQFPESPNELDAEWEVRSEWLDDVESPAYSNFPQRESDGMSTFTFGCDEPASPDESSQSHDSATMVSTEIDDKSVESTEPLPLDSMDEQLLASPIDSFAAVCWTSATSERQPRSSISVPELRLSRLFSEEARDYEKRHYHDYAEEAVESLPSMQFSPEFVTRVVPNEEVAPWMYLPRKVVSVLDLPDDPRTVKERSSQDFCRGHRRGQKSLSALTRRAMSCLNGVGSSEL